MYLPTLLGSLGVCLTSADAAVLLSEMGSEEMRGMDGQRSGSGWQRPIGQISI